MSNNAPRWLAQQEILNRTLISIWYYFSVYRKPKSASGCLRTLVILNLSLSKYSGTYIQGFVKRLYASTDPRLYLSGSEETHRLKSSLRVQQCSPCLSTREDSFFFGGSLGQAEVSQKSLDTTDADELPFSNLTELTKQRTSQDQKTMPKHTNSVRGGSTKRKDMTTDANRDQGLRSPNSVGLSHSSTEGPRNPAIASANGTLQRLAGIARYFGSSFHQDIDVVEGTFGTDMERDYEIED